MARPFRRASSDESGAALIIVVAVAAVLTLLMSLLVALSVNGARQASSDSNWNGALAAAYAAIDEYQSRISNDTSYYRFGNSASAFSAGSTVTLDPSNPAFGVGTAGTWARVATGDGEAARAEFRYEVDNSKYGSSGRVRIRATGKVGDATRSIIADLKQQGFIDFLYFTDYEIQDPAVFGALTDRDCFTDATKTTIAHSWEGRKTGSTCREIAFGAFDTIDGPVHTNDTLRACGTVFKGTVTSGYLTSPHYTAKDANGNTCTAPTFGVAGPPTYGGSLPMPATNAELKKETRTDLTLDVPRPGCLYTGPTQITFNADGTMNVKSPFSKKTRIGDAAASATNASSPSDCGTPSQLQSPAGATIPVPENNVIYVQNVPAVTTDANYWSDSVNPTSFTCTANVGWSLGSSGAGNLSGYPMAGEYQTTTTSLYGCRTGDVFVKGTFNGAATVAAENYIFVVGDVKYVDGQDDMLGLVGNNAVWVYNPVSATATTTTTGCPWRCVTKTTYGAPYTNLLPNTGRTIQAAILSVAHTFQVQNYGIAGAQGTLSVLGAIAQKFRGTVATANAGSGTVTTGYAKDYQYDTRFRFMAPPKFLNPVTTTYGVTTWVETSAVFNADGSAR